MSFQAMTAALAVRGLGPSDKLLLLAIANYAGPDDQCYPSHKRLSEDTGLSQRTILTCFKRLEDASLLTREARLRADGSRGTDAIILSIGGATISPRGAKLSPRGEKGVEEVGKPLRGGGEAVAPLTTFEPVKEPKKEEPLSPPAPVAGYADDAVVDDGEPTKAPALFVAAWTAYPHHLKRSSRKDTLAAWRRLSPVGKANLPKAARAYSSAEAKRPKRPDDAGPPAMERWIVRELWANWLEDDLPSTPVVAFAGPPDLRRAVVGKAGEDFARSWLDPCGWQDVPFPALAPRTRFGAEKLEREVGPVLAHFGITIQQEAA